MSETCERVGDWIGTYTGKRVYPLDPRPGDFDIRDIAHSLSMVARFLGHTHSFYSVAQHCVLCARQAPAALKYEALMHDRAEAYLCDIPRPVKKSLPDYAWHEDQIEAASAVTFELPLRMSPQVKVIDNRMLSAEARQLFSHSDPWWLDPPYDNPFVIDIRPWTPARAERLFLENFDTLAPVRVRQRQGR